MDIGKKRIKGDTTMSIDAKTAKEMAANSEAYKKNMEAIYSSISNAASIGKFYVDINCPTGLLNSRVLDELKSKGFVVERLVIGLEDIIAPTLSKRSEYRIYWSKA